MAFTLPSVASATPVGGVVISEVFFNPPGFFDDGNEWIEIYNGTGSAITLSDYSLGWGRNSYDDGTYVLGSSLTPGTQLAAGATFVIGGPVSDGDNGNPIFDEVYNFAPNLPNGIDFFPPVVADAIGLFFGDIGTTPALLPVHSVIYGRAGSTTSLLDEQGQPASLLFTTNGVPAGTSMEWAGGETWNAQSNENPGTPPTPEPGTALLVIGGLAGLARASRRRRGL